MTEKTTLYGFVTASTSKNNPLQTILELTLTDFQPNANNTAIPLSETENIIKRAINMPVKMLLTRSGVQGHDKAYTVGSITNVWFDEHDQSIKATATIWKDEYKDEDEYVRKEIAEGRSVGTSWEIYYADSVLENGIKWIKDTIFAATCIVSNPAYGNRTLISSVAETEQETAQLDEETQEKLNQLMADCDILVSAIYDAYSKLYNQVYDESIERNAKSALDRLTDMLSSYMSMAEDKAKAEQDIISVRAEIETIKDKQIKDRLYELRRSELAQLTTLPENSYDMLVALDETAYQFMVTGLKAVAQTNPKITIPPSMSSDRTLTTAELAHAIRNKE